MVNPTMKKNVTKRASFEIPGNLLYAVLVALLIIVFYFTTAEYAKKESEKVYGAGGGNVGAGLAYEGLKKICMNWASYIGLCPQCDCANCRDAFLQEISVFSAYYVPYYVSASKLVIYDKDADAFTPNPYLSYQPPSADCLAGGCTLTQKCAEALTQAMGISPLTGDFMGETKKALYPATDDATVKSEAKDRRDKLRKEYSEPCAKVCVWVTQRAQQCALGPETCAREALTGQTLP